MSSLSLGISRPSPPSSPKPPATAPAFCSLQPCFPFLLHIPQLRTHAIPSFLVSPLSNETPTLPSHSLSPLPAPSSSAVDHKPISQPETSNSLEKNNGTVRFDSIYDFNKALVSFAASNRTDSALKLFDDLPDLHLLPPNSFTYSVIISCYCKKNDPFKAKRVLDSMVKDGFHPNVIALTALINSFCRRGRMQKAFEVFRFMLEIGCKPNVQTYNCLLKGLCYVGKVEEATSVLSKMRDSTTTTTNNNNNTEEEKLTYPPDIYSYTAVMDGLCKVGRSDEALELLHQAINSGLSPTVVTYNSLFNGYCKEGTPRKGIRLLRLMQDRGCQPDYITYSSLLHGLLKWGKIKDAFRIHKEMLDFGFKVDERMMNTLLRALCRRSWAAEELEEQQQLLGHVYQVFDRMRSWDYQIYRDTRCVFIHTLCVFKETDRAMIELNEMVASGHFPRMVAVNRIIRGLCEEARIEEALSVLILVLVSYRVPSKISFNFLIHEFNRRGDTWGACTVYAAGLKLGVTPHKKPSSLMISSTPTTKARGR